MFLNDFNFPALKIYFSQLAFLNNEMMEVNKDATRKLSTPNTLRTPLLLSPVKDKL